MGRWKHWRPGDHPRARWLVPVVPVVLALGLLIAACGGSPGNGTDGVATAGGSKKAGNQNQKKDPQQAALEFARCMREHGVDMLDPEGSDGLIRVAPGTGGGADAVEQPFDENFAEAEKACRHLLDDLVQGQDAPVDPKEQDRALKFAQCMREHGVDMPDPDFSRGGLALTIKGVDPNSQVFKDAQKACSQFFGPPGGGPGVQAREGARA